MYLFWDPAYAHLAPGKFTALMEIEWVAGVSLRLPQLKYYYMGFYIHRWVERIGICMPTVMILVEMIHAI